MSNEFNAKNGLRIGWGHPVSAITNNTLISENDNNLATEGSIYRTIISQTSGATGDFVNTSGDTMTGDLIVSAVTSANQFLSNYDNRILIGRNTDSSDRLTADTRFNIFIGDNVGQYYTISNPFANNGGNTVIGENAFISGGTNTSTIDRVVLNTIVGKDAGKLATVQNCYFGVGAGEYNHGRFNIGIGVNSNSNTTESTQGNDYNNFIGFAAGQYSIGSNNVGNGGRIAVNNSGSSNVFLGFYTAHENIGDDNIIIGRNAGYNNNSNNSILLGQDVGYNNTISHRLMIDSSNTDNPLLDGSFSARTLDINGSLTVTSGISVQYIDYATGTTDPTPKAGRVYYDESEKALSYYPETPNMDVTINIGQEGVIYVFNSGATITNGQVCHIHGSYNGAALVELADASDSSEEHKSLVSGVATHDIPSGNYGFITFYGKVRDLTLTGVTEGSDVYLSDSTPGGVVFSTNELNISSRVSRIGHVLQTGVTDGILQVEIINENIITNLSQRQGEILAQNNSSTGLRNGGVITLTSGEYSANTGEFDIASGEGYIVDNTTDPDEPTLSVISWEAMTGNVMTYLTASTATYITIDINGNVKQYPVTSSFDGAEKRSEIFLGLIGHGSKFKIDRIFNFPIHIISPVNQHEDLVSSIGPFNINGNILEPINGTLQLYKTTGKSYMYGSNFQDDSTSPSVISTPLLSGDTLVFVKGDGIIGESGNTIDTYNYDLDGTGTLQNIPNNKFTAHRIWYTPKENRLFFQYGQDWYDTEQDARNNFSSEPYIVPPAISPIAYLTTVIIVQEGETDLSNSVFIPQGKFAGSGGGGGGATGTLQSAYDNSTNPEILTNSTLGAVDFRVGSGSDSDQVVTIQNNSGDINAAFQGDGGLDIGTGNTNTGGYSITHGYEVSATSIGSHAQGYQNLAGDTYSHAEGYQNTVLGDWSHAEGRFGLVTAQYAHGEGQGYVVNGQGAHAEGISCSGSGVFSHAEGSDALASGTYSHAEGRKSTVLSDGYGAHAEGAITTANNHASHSEGRSTVASGKVSHAEGVLTTAFGSFTDNDDGGAHAEGKLTVALSGHSHSEGYATTAAKYGAHSEGSGTTADGEYSHASGIGSIASGVGSHAEGNSCKVFANYAHAEGDYTTASGRSAHAEGYLSLAIGPQTHAEGSGTTASGNQSHSEGYQTKASGDYSHAEGYQTTANSFYSHSEGVLTYANNNGAHAEGNNTTASGNYSHAEGSVTKATGDYSHSQNQSTLASGIGSHAGGYNTNVNANYTFGHSNQSSINNGAVNSAILGGSGHTINDNITGSLILGGENLTASSGNTVFVSDLNINSLSGTSNRSVHVNPDGTLIEGDELGELYITDSGTITALETESNWNGTLYTGNTLTAVTEGQRYVTSAYTYEYVDTTMFRNGSIDTTTLNNTYVNIDGDTMTGQLNSPALSATTISGDTIYQNNEKVASENFAIAMAIALG
jgi:hypothetical protein